MLDENVVAVRPATVYRVLKKYELLSCWNQSKGAVKERVKSAVEEVLDCELPEDYTQKLFKAKLDAVFNKICEYAESGEKWVA